MLGIHIAKRSFDGPIDFIPNLIQRDTPQNIADGAAAPLAAVRHGKIQGSMDDRVVVATVIRLGKKVSVARMELNNENNEAIALGTATYLIG